MNYILQPTYKTNRRGMMRKLEVTSGRSQDNSFIVITLCTPSQTVRAERRIISCSVEVHRRHQKNIYITGCVVRKQIEDRWNVDGEKELIVRCMDRIHKICSTKGEATRRIYMVRGETYKKTKKLLVLICGNLCPMQRKIKQSKDGLSRNQSSTMPDN